MSNHSTNSPRFPIFQRLWKPVAITGAGGTAIAYWLEEIVIFGEEILALIFLPILAGAIYLLDILIFKSRMPRREDKAPSRYREYHEKPVDRGAKK
jgi:hypothetical protein